MSFQSSILYRDLNSQSREAVYCAIAYLVRSGGPAFDGEANLENLRMHRKPLILWLLQRDDQAAIIDGYPQFIRTWSPVFPE